MKNYGSAAAGNEQLERALADLDFRVNGSPLTTGNKYYVIPAGDGNYVEFYEKYQHTYLDGTLAVHNTIASAYAAVTSNRHDVIFLSANAAHAQTSMLSIAKNRMHMVGLNMRGGGFGMGARTRITMGVTTAATDLGVLQNTGVGNTFRNLKFDSSNTKAESLYSIVEAGEYAIWENCEFYKSTDLDETAAAEVANNGDSAQWLGCYFGSTANIVADNKIRPNMLCSGGIVSGKKLRDNIVERCIFASKAGGTEHVAIYGANATDIERMLLVKDSVFLNNILSAATPAHAVGFGAAQTQGVVLLKNCTAVDHTVMKQAAMNIYVDGAVPTHNTTGVSVTG
jgi:hypothetical protein